jgi:hypothetical protein
MTVKKPSRDFDGLTSFEDHRMNTRAFLIRFYVYVCIDECDPCYHPNRWADGIHIR